MDKIKKAVYYLAKYHSLSNAAEFIRSHVEEGFCYNDNELNKAYKRENQKLYGQLAARAYVFWEKYTDMGIEINSEME